MAKIPRLCSENQRWSNGIFRPSYS